MTPTQTDKRSHAPSIRELSEDHTFDHGAISRFNAWFFTAFEKYINRIARHHKTAAFDGIEASTVLEIGPGTGANSRHLVPGTRVYALEPSRAMHDQLRERYAASGIDVTILPAGAEDIPLPDASVDEVICSLVLCTVEDPERVLEEIRRVLRPGGRFRFVEHVAAPRRGVRRLVQRVIRRPWGWLFEGCDPGRHTPRLIQAAGFADVQMEHRRFRRSIFWPVNSAVWGIAHR